MTWPLVENLVSSLVLNDKARGIKDKRTIIIDLWQSDKLKSDYG